MPMPDDGLNDMKQELEEMVLKNKSKRVQSNVLKSLLSKFKLPLT
jgi:hypothetical protein